MLCSSPKKWCHAYISFNVLMPSVMLPITWEALCPLTRLPGTAYALTCGLLGPINFINIMKLLQLKIVSSAEVMHVSRPDPEKRGEQVWDSAYSDNMIRSDELLLLLFIWIFDEGNCLVKIHVNIGLQVLFVSGWLSDGCHSISLRTLNSSTMTASSRPPSLPCTHWAEYRALDGMRSASRRAHLPYFYPRRKHQPSGGLLSSSHHLNEWMEWI